MNQVTFVSLAIQAEITQVLVIQEIMHHHQEIILTVIMVIPVHVMTIHQEAIGMWLDLAAMAWCKKIFLAVKTSVLGLTHISF